MAHAYVAKALWNIPTTKALIAQLKANTTLRRLCCWEDGPLSVPSESIFSRAFALFADIGLGQSTHEALISTHLGGTLEANLRDMPEVSCNHGCKKNSQGNTDSWRGYNLHLVTGDGHIPLCAYLSSASMHDSQAAIILEQSVAQRTKAYFISSKTAPMTRRPSVNTA